VCITFREPVPAAFPLPIIRHPGATVTVGEPEAFAEVLRAYAAAVAAGKEKLNDSSWNTFSRYLYAADLPEPDLVIRTSGEARISNFLLLQAAYAEFVFTPVLWPDFTKADLAGAIADFARRERRYGLTSEQLKPAVTAAK
jgi:undecaprenyl diphosphate synthase